MAKLRDAPITKDDINEYLRDSSDFAFEILVLRKVTSLGFECAHAGTYEDPITKKGRQFDIRARKRLIDEANLRLEIFLSIECKNLKSNFPLVVHCLPREEGESYLDLVWSSDPTRFIPLYENAMRVPLFGEFSPYQEKDPVGKSCDQVGRRATQEAEIVGNDSDVYDKISQAVNASYDLIQEAHYAAEKSVDVITMVIPVLVVPNDRIWTVWYKKTGEIEREPLITDNVEYYIGKSWLIGDANHEFRERYFLSHLEIVQIDRLPQMVAKFTRLQIATSPKTLRGRKLEALQSRDQ